MKLLKTFLGPIPARPLDNIFFNDEETGESVYYDEKEVKRVTLVCTELYKWLQRAVDGQDGLVQASSPSHVADQSLTFTVTKDGVETSFEMPLREISRYGAGTRGNRITKELAAAFGLEPKDIDEIIKAKDYYHLIPHNDGLPEDVETITPDQYKAIEEDFSMDVPYSVGIPPSEAKSDTSWKTEFDAFWSKPTPTRPLKERQERQANLAKHEQFGHLARIPIEYVPVKKNG